MIEELTSYFSEGFYKEKDERIVKALEDYEKGRDLGDEGIELRETARAELEEQLVASGQAEADTVFINPEEFFPEGKRDQERIDNFRKDMTKKLANQQMLWSFAGTTGSMTVITEKHLESMGRDLDGLKPAALRRETAKVPKAAPGAVPLYLYGDGTAGQIYNKDKAKLSFDKCRDKSGFDWRQAKYDPNYSVEKNGWFGGVNKDGVWEVVETGRSVTTEDMPGLTAPIREIELIYTLNGALIFDAALLLCGPEEEEYYYSLDGELYGAVKTDRVGTVEKLKEALGGVTPAGVVLPAGVDEGTREAYERLLEELGTTNNTNNTDGKKEGVGLADYTDFSKGANGISRIYEETDEAWQLLLAEDRVQREELEKATLALGAAARLRQQGMDEEVIGVFLESEESGIEVPLNPFVKEDRTVLLDETLAVLEPDDKKAVQDSVESWFERKGGEIGSDEMVHALPVVTAAFPLLAAALEKGMGIDAVLEEALWRGTKDARSTESSDNDVFNGITGKKAVPTRSSAKVKLNGRVTLEELSRGITPFGMKHAVADSPDFFNGETRIRAAEAAGLKEGEIVSLAEGVDKLNMPPMDRKEFNKRLAAVLSNYHTVQMSTGMTVSDLVSTVDSITMKRPDAKKLGNKEIYFEKSLGELLAAGQDRSIPTKTVNREELFKPLLADVPDFVTVLDHGIALTLTEGLLSALIAAPSPEAQPLSSRQLSSLKGLYTNAGATAVVASEAVKQWEAVRFTPEEYKAVRANLKKKLLQPLVTGPSQDSIMVNELVQAKTSVANGEASVIINPVELTDSLLTALMMNPSPESQPLRQAEIADLDRVYRKGGVKQEEIRTALKQWEQVRFTPEEFKAVRSVLKKKLEAAGTSGIVSPVTATKAETGSLSAVLATFQFTAEERKAVQAVREAYRTEESAAGTGMEHSMTNEMLMPLVSRALAGQWGGIPAEVRPVMNRALRRSTVRQHGDKKYHNFSSSGNNMNYAINRGGSDNIGSLFEGVKTSRHTFRPATRQLSLNVKPVLSQSNGYSRIGYRVNPNRDSISSIHGQSAGSLLNADFFTGINKGLNNSIHSLPLKAQVVRSSFGNTTSNIDPRIGIPAQVSNDRNSSTNVKNFPHPVTYGQGINIQAGNMTIPGKQSMQSAVGGFDSSQNNRLDEPNTRMDRINANYLSDKENLGQGDNQRMLAKTAGQSPGSAGGTGGGVKTSSAERMKDEIIEDILKEWSQGV